MPPAPSAPSAWRNVWVLGLTILFTLTAITSWNRIIANRLRDLGAHPELIGWCFFAFTVAHRIPGLLGGWLADRFGRKPIFVACTTLMGLGFIGVGLARTPVELTIALSFSWGMGAVQWPAMVSLLIDSVDYGSRGRALAILEMCGMFGFTMGPLVGALVVEKAGGLDPAWRILLLGSCAVYLVVAAVRATFARETWREEDHLERDPVQFGRALLPVSVCVLLIASSLLTEEGPAVGLYVEDATGGSAATVNWVHFAGGGTALAAAWVAGRLTDRYGPRKIVAAGTFLQAACFLPFAWPGLPGWAAKGLFIAAMVPVELFTVGYQNLITRIAPRGRRALYVGMSTTATGVLSTWALVACGHLYREGPRLPFIVGGAIALASFVLAVPLAMRKDEA